MVLALLMGCGKSLPSTLAAGYPAKCDSPHGGWKRSSGKREETEGGPPYPKIAMNTPLPKVPPADKGKKRAAFKSHCPAVPRRGPEAGAIVNIQLFLIRGGEFPFIPVSTEP